MRDSGKNLKWRSGKKEPRGGGGGCRLNKGGQRNRWEKVLQKGGKEESGEVCGAVSQRRSASSAEQTGHMNMKRERSRIGSAKPQSWPIGVAVLCGSQPLKPISHGLSEREGGEVDRKSLSELEEPKEKKTRRWTAGIMENGGRETHRCKKYRQSRSKEKGKGAEANTKPPANVKNQAPSLKSLYSSRPNPPPSGRHCLSEREESNNNNIVEK